MVKWYYQLLILRFKEKIMVWQQVYDPFNNMVVSTLLAAIPVVVMLVALGFMHIKAHIAAGLGLVAALVVAILAYGMPAEMAGKAAMYGGLTGLLPIGWIVLNIIFLQRVLFWCLLRRRGRLWHPCGSDRRHLDWLGFFAFGCIGLELDRQHGARGLWCLGYTRHHAGQGSRL
jgi:L-lactate permease